MQRAFAADAGVVASAGQYAKPLDRAEDLIYDAWEAAGPRRAELAREALALWPDCADAYVLLAQAASSLQEARELLERASLGVSERLDGGCLQRTPVTSG